MSPDQYCQDRAAKSGSSFYYSFLFLPPDKRRAITALYAFCREVDDVVDEGLDPEVARMKLAWWRTEIGSVFSGGAQHPVARALVAVTRQFHLPESGFNDIIDGMEMDLTRNRYADFDELETYCYRVAGVVGLMAAEIFGYRDRQTLSYAKNLGTAFQLTNIIRDVGEDALRNRIYLPLDELARFGVSPEQVLHPDANTDLRELIAFQIDRARQYYARAFDALPAEDRRAQRPGLVMAAIYLKLLDRIEGDGCRVLERRVSLSPIRKLWIAWTTWMRG
ncbi:MAG: presqualene diphosphate synthase HpnD [Burkholderiales bacterium]